MTARPKVFGADKGVTAVIAGTAEHQDAGLVLSDNLAGKIGGGEAGLIHERRLRRRDVAVFEATNGGGTQ